MTQAFTIKIRKIGTSAGVLLPKQQLEDAEVGVGDEIEVAILPHKKDFSGFGMAKNFTPFKRDKTTREFS
ncbi:hypothetical protein HYU19_04865 [Candidatus Woesearchaeota archaeon]|nr:hypothetical protein [Candidatus Woesearchaeota archaeon]